VDVWARYGGALQPFLDAGLVVHAAPTLRLSREGMLLANEILAVFV
jgi:coproporphyrinogen III oxidase-like Fe-S oxidoreductase